MSIWQDGLRFVREQISSLPLNRRDLWHGQLFGEYDRNPWPLVAVHEPLARKSFAGVDWCIVDLQQVERGRYFGDRSALDPFRRLSSAAFRAILDYGPHQARAGAIRRPNHPSDFSPCWMDLLHDLAESCPSVSLRAPIRSVQLFGPTAWPADEGDGTPSAATTDEAQNIDSAPVPDCFDVDYSFLEQDVFTATCAAIDLLLNEQLPPWRPESMPRWDGVNRELWWGDVVIRKYTKHPARSQIDVIEAFESAGWPRTLPNPPFGTDTKKLRDTIDSLNEGLPPGTIRFSGNGTGAGVCWAPAADDRPG